MVGLPEVLREWGRIGVVGFGGPPAHVALLRDLVVDRRGWMDAREFEDANAACGLLPGPASTQLAIFCAHRVAGTAGALVGGVAFIVPGLALILLLSAGSLSADPPAWLLGLAAGAGAAVVPVVVQAGLTLARSSVAGLRGARLARACAYLAVGAAATIAIGANVVVALLACGLVELAIRRTARPPRTAALHAWPVLVLAAAGDVPRVAWTALKVGALSYGGGFVIIPLMRGDAVDAYGWMTQGEFLDAVAFGQLTPGPVVQTVAVVGYAAAGLGGALLAAVVAFAPSFALIIAGGRFFAALRASAPARAFLDGAGPAAVGAITGAAVPLAAGIDTTWQVVVAALAAGALLARRAPIVVLLAAAVAGLAVALLGAPLPG